MKSLKPLAYMKNMVACARGSLVPGRCLQILKSAVLIDPKKPLSATTAERRRRRMRMRRVEEQEGGS